MAEQKKDVNIQIKVDDAVAVGSYANFANIAQSREEFIMDFLFVQPAPPPGFGKLVSRIILSPGHAKRLSAALADAVTRYEQANGTIDAQPPEGAPLQ